MTATIRSVVPSIPVELTLQANGKEYTCSAPDWRPALQRLFRELEAEGVLQDVAFTVRELS